MEPVLLTRRLALRRFTAADVGNLLELDGDPEWADPLEGNEGGDVEYRLRRADWAG